MIAAPQTEERGPGIAMPKRAMVLAAGLGTRLRPITRTVPKPLVKIAGVAMIDSVLDRLAASGVEEAVVNTHHLAEMLHEVSDPPGLTPPPTRTWCSLAGARARAAAVPEGDAR